jgi:hypothetical protein
MIIYTPLSFLSTVPATMAIQLQTGPGTSISSCGNISVSLSLELPQPFIFITTNTTPVLEPFPFLADVDLHPNGNSSTIIIRNPTISRPVDIIFTTSPRLPLPQTQTQDPRNRFRGLPPPGGFYVPGMATRYPPPVMGILIGGGEEVG